jgi:hypothetical protein
MHTKLNIKLSELEKPALSGETSCAKMRFDHFLSSRAGSGWDLSLHLGYCVDLTALSIDKVGGVSDYHSSWAKFSVWLGECMKALAVCNGAWYS